MVKHVTSEFFVLLCSNASTKNLTDQEPALKAKYFLALGQNSVFANMVSVIVYKANIVHNLVCVGISFVIHHIQTEVQ